MSMTEIHKITPELREMILEQVRTLLDTGKPIHFQILAETVENENLKGQFIEYEVTGAKALCLSIVNAPAVLWSADVEALKRGDQ